MSGITPDLSTLAGSHNQIQEDDTEGPWVFPQAPKARFTRPGLQDTSGCNMNLIAPFGMPVVPR